jgi:hypothetical protein
VSGQRRAEGERPVAPSLSKAARGSKGDPRELSEQAKALGSRESVSKHADVDVCEKRWWASHRCIPSERGLTRTTKRRAAFTVHPVGDECRR